MIMLFSNMFFIMLFLPVFMIVYHLAATLTGGSVKTENIVLALFSLIFYAFGGVSGIFVLIIATLVGWVSGLMLALSEGKPAVKKIILAVTVIVLAGGLAFFKYAGFFSNIVMPLGLSFYIFQLISYVADVYMEKIPAEEGFINFFLYTACFHHVLQGPIVRYGDVAVHMRKRKYSITTLSNGIYRFCIGLAKKVILADHAGAMADNLLPKSEAISGMPTLGIWLGSVCFTLQMFLDFSAYTDMAIGLGQMIGFKYPENFDFPYISKSVKEFWRRWHISLSSFFRDYVYIPLGGNRKGEGRKIFNLLVVWLLTGIWHGATVNFVIWGLYYFVFLVIENKLTASGKGSMPSVLAHIYAILVFNFGWLIFRFENVGQLGTAVAAFFGFQKNGFTSHAVTVAFKNNLFFLIVAVLACTPFFKWLQEKFERMVKNRELSAGLVFGGRTIVAIAALLLGIMVMAGSSYQPFLYNQF